MIDLQGRTALVTGASMGLGRAIAFALVKAGADVFICARTESELSATAEALEKEASGKQTVRFAAADIGSVPQMDQLFLDLQQAFPRLDILVNNAGVYGPFGAIEDVDWQHWIDALHTNLTATVYASRLAVPIMRRQKYGKIINISGGGATSPLPGISAYAASKAGVVRFTETLAHETAADNIDVNAIAPGILDTRLTDQLLSEGKDVLDKAFVERISSAAETGGTPLSLGADLCVYLASSQSDGITGRLIAAQWDAWEDLQAHSEEIASSDIYTLRRIIPADRGQDWGDR